MGPDPMTVTDGRPGPRAVFWTFSGLMLAALFVGLVTEAYWLALLPAAALLLFLLVADPAAVFFLLLSTLPLSTEIALPNGFGTDLPSEPLMLLLTATAILFALRHGGSRPILPWRHPISILLLLHLGWIGVCALLAIDPFVSGKYFLAKAWYVVPFYFVAGHILTGPRAVQRLFGFLFVPLVFTMIVTLARHAAFGFRFADVYRVLHPFYRNHVIYGAIMVVFMPYLWFVLRWQRPGSWTRWALALAVPLFLVAIYLSYSRAAYVALMVAVGAHWVLRLHLTRYVLLAAVALGLGLAVFFSAGNRYLDYAPDYERTITHRDFDNLIEATYQFEDISTMERVYRWVAAAFMVGERPWFGFGPGNFYPTYKEYTVTRFQTYVSHNPEGSGIHNYFLMILVEQGWPGLLIFAVLVATALLCAERLYHRLPDRREKEMALIAFHSLVIILTLSLINDLLETDKIGPFFFIGLALLARLDAGSGRGTPGA